MMHFLKIWGVTTGVFLTGDLLWLYFVLNRFLVPQIKHLMTVTSRGIEINYLSAMIAYLLIAAALTWFIIIPLHKEALITIFLQGAFLGLCIYGVYECTNYAILLNWPLPFLIVDIVWGMVWCGLASVMSVMLLF